MIRFSHSANSWQRLGAVSAAAQAWFNIEPDVARMLLDNMGLKVWHFSTIRRV